MSTQVQVPSPKKSINNNSNNNAIRQRLGVKDSSAIDPPPSKIIHSPIANYAKKSDLHTFFTTKALIYAITFITACVRLYGLHQPANIVFDEVHFGKFSHHYFMREFYFDVHPPLGKLLIALTAWLGGYDGRFSWVNLGASFADSVVPYVWMRAVQAVLGIATVFLGMSMLEEMGVHDMGIGLSGIFMALDGPLINQVRYILLDSQLMLYMMLALYSWVRFRKLRHVQPFGAEWWKWLALTGLGLGATMSVKMIGLFLVATIGVATLVDLWELADVRKRHLSDKTFFHHFYARALCLIILPLTVYVGSFWVHFKILNKTGPGDALMSPEFQATLKGNMLSSTSRTVKYGQQVRVKSRVEETFLHSHSHLIPKQHEDGKVSSGGQQVNGYPTPDSNNIWVILPPKGQEPALLGQPVKSTEVIRLKHMTTGKVLLTHDVASPLTRTNMEMTAVDPEDPNHYPGTEWKVVGKAGLGLQNSIQSLATHFWLINVKHGVHLSNHQKNLPAWGFNQREINGERRPNLPQLTWSISEILDPITPEEQRFMRELASKIPRIGFWSKFLELQLKMLISNSNLHEDHPNRSGPLQWIMGVVGLAFWENKPNSQRVYSVPSLPGWWSSAIAVFMSAFRLARDQFFVQRGWIVGMDAKREHLLHKYWNSMGFLLMAFLFHYVPFYFMGRTLYPHHYLPSYLIATLISGLMIDYVIRWRHQKHVAYGLSAVLIMSTVFWFKTYAFTVYGWRTADGIRKHLQLYKGWEWP